MRPLLLIGLLLALTANGQGIAVRGTNGIAQDLLILSTTNQVIRLPMARLVRLEFTNSTTTNLVMFSSSAVFLPYGSGTNVQSAIRANNSTDLDIGVDSQDTWFYAGQHSPGGSIHTQITDTNTGTTAGLTIGSDYLLQSGPFSTGFILLQEGGAGSAFGGQSAAGVNWFGSGPFLTQGSTGFTNSGQYFGDGSGLVNISTTNVLAAVGNELSRTVYLGYNTNTARASGAAQGLQTTVATNVVSLNLLAGDWAVAGNLNFAGSTATITATSAGISLTTGTLPTDGSETASGVVTTVLTETDGVTLSSKIIHVTTATTNVYFVGKCTFSAGSVTAYGSATAWRIR